MAEDEQYNFAETNPRVEDLIAEAQAGDIAGFAETAREMTQFERLDMMVWALIAIMALNAVSNFIRRSGDAGRAVIEVLAERIREDGMPPPPPPAPPAV